MGSARATGILVACVLMLGAGSCRYAEHRGRDLVDVVTLAAESSGTNLAVQCGPLVTGVGKARGTGFGLRSGAVGRYTFDERNLLVIGSRCFSPSEELGGKRYELAYDHRGLLFLLLLVAILSQADCRRQMPQLEDPPISLENAPPLELSGAWHVLLQVEVAASAGVGGRAGVNLGELLDFLLGWTTLDICGDDVLPRAG
ncbi:MAG: hypothetical protein AB1486_12580 [Planctomycetota bacterium]